MDLCEAVILLLYSGKTYVCFPSHCLIGFDLRCRYLSSRPEADVSSYYLDSLDAMARHDPYAHRPAAAAAVQPVALQHYPYYAQAPDYASAQPSGPLSDALRSLLQRLTGRCQVESATSRVNSALDALYAQFQCTTCGLRFAVRERLQEHMDIHVRATMKRRKATMSRSWYVPRHEWYMTTVYSGQNSYKPFFGDPFAQVEDIRAEVPGTVVVAAGDVDCAVCGERMKPHWDDQYDQWVFRDVVELGDGGLLAHAPCSVPPMIDSPPPKRVKPSDDTQCR